MPKVARSQRPFRGCGRTGLHAIQRIRSSENLVPEGRSTLAQRFSAGTTGRIDSSPGEPALSVAEGDDRVVAHTLEPFGTLSSRRGRAALQRRVSQMWTRASARVGVLELFLRDQVWVGHDFSRAVIHLLDSGFTVC